MMYAWLAGNNVPLTWEGFNALPWPVLQALRTYMIAKNDDLKRQQSGRS